MGSKKLSVYGLSLLVSAVFASSAVAQDINIVSDTREGSALSRSKLVDIIEEEIVGAVSEQYSEINIELSSEGSLTKAMLFMLAANTWTLERVRIMLDDSGYILETVYNPEPDRAAIEATDSVGGCPDASVDMVFATMHDNISTAEDAVYDACASATAAGYSCHTIVGSGATVSAYQNWLSCDLLAFGSVGHGSPQGIWLEDGFLRYSWFDTLASDDLEETVIYLNSCQVHNNPLLQSIMDAGTRTYAGGINNLYIGPSEAVFECFWSGTLLSGGDMEPTLLACEAAEYPYTGAHGISGDLGPF